MRLAHAWRASLTIAPLLFALAEASCAHDPPRAAPGAPALKEVAAPAPPPTSQYVLADAANGRATMLRIPLPRGAEGVVVDGQRLVMGLGVPRRARDVPAAPFVGVTRLPGRFGGGFLFWTERELYRADTFDGGLVPITRVPQTIERVALGPRAALVRARNGERWSVALPSGDRAPIGLHGLADVGALDDGRAIAMTDRGLVLTSVDRGERWSDVTAEITGAPERVAVVGEELWLFASVGAFRLEPAGHLTRSEARPVDPAERRPTRPRWQAGGDPRRALVRSGAAVSDGTAVVVEHGDVYRIDLHTGELVSIVSGRLPPDARCEGVPVQGDVLFACLADASAFVVARTLTGAPVVEQSLPPVGRFFASDDGGLVYSGPCDDALPGTVLEGVACVRTPSGAWEQRDLSGALADGGAGDVTVARWIPRADGRAVAIVTAPALGLYDPQTGAMQALPDDLREVMATDVLHAPSAAGIRRMRSRLASMPGPIVDTRWSFAGAALRGWNRQGAAVELSEDGRLSRSPWSLDVVFAGALGLGRSKDGRLYQSTDHGASFREIAQPPSGSAFELLGCTSAGCDLGAFYRMGWAPTPAEPPGEQEHAAGPPDLRPTPPFQLACHARGPASSKVLARSNDAPEDLGLGAASLPVANERSGWSYVRMPVSRAIVSPLREPMGGDGDALALRAVFSGFGTSREGDTLVVNGPNPSPLALRRTFSFVAPFDPAARVVQATLAMSDVVSAARRAAIPLDEVFSEDPTESGAVVPLTPLDPAGPADLAIDNGGRGLFALVRGERVRVAMRAAPTNTTILSGAVLGAGDEAALLELESGGGVKVLKVGPAGFAEQFDISAIDESYYPANPDALAVGPKGELAVVRVPSGSDPPSLGDPALLLVPGAPAVALAPWSELRLAGDPACTSDPAGYRVTLQLPTPWIRVVTPELSVDEGPMLARVRWSPHRVCLEALEARLPSVIVRPPEAGASGELAIATWLVGSGASFARVAVADGVEWRQPLACAPATGSSAGP